MKLSLLGIANGSAHDGPTEAAPLPVEVDAHTALACALRHIVRTVGSRPGVPQDGARQINVDAYKRAVRALAARQGAATARASHTTELSHGQAVIRNKQLLAHARSRILGDADHKRGGDGKPTGRNALTLLEGHAKRAAVPSHPVEAGTVSPLWVAGGTGGAD